MKHQLNLVQLLFISIALSFNLLNTSSAEPPNLTKIKKELIYYHDSGLYSQELTKKINEAQQYIMEQAQAHQRQTPNKKLAIVLDVDETSLSNYKYMVKHHFFATRSQIHRDIQAANSPVIKPMLALYQKAQRQGINVFFITGRFESERLATEHNLMKAGYKNWAGLYLRPDNYNLPSIVPFKSKMREMISKKGYTIIASIGDQCSDFRGGYVKRGFKLPNPYYYLP